MSGGAGDVGVVVGENLGIKAVCRLEGCDTMRCVEVWPSVYVALFGCGGTPVVAVIELVGEEWPEVVAKFRGGCKWEQVWRTIERLARKNGVCDRWETYDVCLREEVGRVSELVCEFFAEGFQKTPAELTRRTDAPYPPLLTTSDETNQRQDTRRTGDKTTLDKDLEGEDHE